LISGPVGLIDGAVALAMVVLTLLVCQRSRVVQDAKSHDFLSCRACGLIVLPFFWRDSLFCRC
jgi:hypothetical protein